MLAYSGKIVKLPQPKELIICQLCNFVGVTAFVEEHKHIHYASHMEATSKFKLTLAALFCSLDLQKFTFSQLLPNSFFSAIVAFPKHNS